MTVAELIEVLKGQQQDLQVVYEKYSEYVLMEPREIEEKTLCVPRSDGWIHSMRPNMPYQVYLVFPGN